MKRLHRSVALSIFVATALSAGAHAQDSDAEPLAQRPVAMPEDVSVATDFASLVRVPANTAMVVVGNPFIADVTMKHEGLVVVTGKSFGTTNIMALDAAGETLRDIIVHVTAPKAPTITVMRGAMKETYSCAPRCETTVNIGDAGDYFSATYKQVEDRDKLSSQRK